MSKTIYISAPHTKCENKTEILNTIHVYANEIIYNKDLPLSPLTLGDAIKRSSAEYVPNR